VSPTVSVCCSGFVAPRSCSWRDAALRPLGFSTSGKEYVRRTKLRHDWHEFFANPRYADLNSSATAFSLPIDDLSLLNTPT
jgi:hypothetical protein